MEMSTEIRRKVFVEGASKRSIRRDYRISARTLEKILANAEPPGYRQRITRPRPMLGQFLPVIDEILDADKSAPPKQRHTAKRIYERLRDEYGYTGCSSQVREELHGEISIPRRSSSRPRTRRDMASSISARQRW